MLFIAVEAPSSTVFSILKKEKKQLRFDHFVQITPGIVKELDNRELSLLGVVSLGDQKRLRSRCQTASTQGKLSFS